MREILLMHILLHGHLTLIIEAYKAGTLPASSLKSTCWLLTPINSCRAFLINHKNAPRSISKFLFCLHTTHNIFSD